MVYGIYLLAHVISVQYEPYWVDNDASAWIYAYHVCMR